MMEPTDPNADPAVLEALHAPEDPVGEAEEGDGASATVEDEDGETDGS